MFEKASRLKVRFAYRGQATPEDLWDIPLEALDAMHSTLRRELDQSQGESLLGTRTTANDTLTLKADLIAHVVRTRLAEREAREQLAERRARKQQVLGIVQQKQDAALAEMDVEALLKLVNELS